MPAREPIGTRLSRKVRQQGDCIVWTGATRPNGYRVIGGSTRGVPYYDQPHRVAYKLAVAPIPAGMQIDHLCQTRACVNPAHLVTGTHLTLTGTRPQPTLTTETEPTS